MNVNAPVNVNGFPIRDETPFTGALTSAFTGRREPVRPSPG
ncbi:MAG TPA: hypothetical protein VGF40_04745 [Thermoanaerobaculia bacterium]